MVAMTLEVDVAGPVNGSGFHLRAQVQLPLTGCIGVYGPSGSGKSTLLRVIAGLSHIPGLIRTPNGVWQNDNLTLPAWQRRAALVPQAPSLVPHQSVMDNLRFATKRAVGGPEVDLDCLAEQFELGPLLAQRADTLSGGQQQRAAIARAVACQPTLLLLDEPLTGLDPAVRQRMLGVLTRLSNEGLAMIYVSHSAAEHAVLADYLLILSDGQVVQCDQATNVFKTAQPGTELARETSVVWADGELIDQADGLAHVRFGEADLELPLSAPHTGPIGARIRADDVSLTRPPAVHSSILNMLPATIVGQKALENSPFILVEMRVGKRLLRSRITQKAWNRLQLALNDKVIAQVKAASIQPLM